MPVVGERAAHRAHLVLRQQQLQLLVATGGIGGAHQPRQHLALRLQGFGQRRALGLLRGQGVGESGLFGVRGIDRLLRLSHARIGLAKRRQRLGFLGFRAFLLRRQCRNALLQRVELGLCFGLARRALRVGGLGEGRRRDEGRRRQQHRQPSGRERAGWPQAGCTSDSPVIAAGFGRPISCSTVGAMSRNAPPDRSVALRPT